MTKQVQRRRGTATQHTSFTGAEGETSVNTTNKSIHVHDGTTTGGFEAARIDLTNVTGATVAGKVTGSTLSSLTITSADINGGTIDSTAIGNTTPSSGIFTTLSASSTLTLGGTAVTSTAAELNYNDITTLGTVQASKTVTANASGDVLFPDGDKAIFGASSDLQIYHDGSNSVIWENGAGDLILRGTNMDVQDSGGYSFIKLTGGGTPGAGVVELKYNNSTKLATTATGIDVTGTVTADGLTVDGLATITTTGVDDAVIIKSTEAGASNSPDLVLQRDSNSPADNDSLGIIRWRGNNDASEAIDLINIFGQVTDVSNGSEDSTLYFKTYSGGAEVSPLTLVGPNVGIGTSSPDAQGGNQSTIFNLEGSDNIVYFSGGSGGNAIDDGLAIEGVATGVTSGDKRTGSILMTRANTSTTSLDSKITFYTTSSGTHASKMTLDASGNLGLGVVPSAWSGTGAAIQLEGTGHLATANQYAYIGSNYYYNGGWKYTTSSTAAQYRQDSGTHQWLTAASGSADAAITWSESMRIDSSGNVGIGITNPSSYGKLAVKGNVIIDRGSENTAVLLELRTNMAGAITKNTINFKNGALSGTAMASIEQFDNGTETYGTLLFKTNNANVLAERMRIDPSGNLLSGTTTSKGSRVQAAGAAASVSPTLGSATDTSLLLTNSDVTYGMNFGVINNGNGWIQQHSNTGTASAYDLLLQPVGGNVGIGTSTSIDAPLTFAGSVGKKINLYSGSDYSIGIQSSELRLATSGIVSFYRDGYSGSESMRIDASGGLILVGSTAQKATGTTWSNPSDQRLKTDIRDYTKGSAELMQVRVREWLYNGKGGTVDGMAGLGVIADEVMTVLPDTVETYEAFLEETDELPTAIKKFDATEITWLLVTSLQEALTKIADMETRLSALEG
jgi:hypothetical protein